MSLYFDSDDVPQHRDAGIGLFYSVLIGSLV